ncbi:LysM peptidoglycan-binding domain-containing protein [Halomonas sp. DQ26W]|uniref:peptidoglycan DD-metalloendopeptidase family protein n=1 Tax=Halomonas sp. DQ26W TaxID=2282311 RepID=UPI000DF83C47|nr:peptidoglycan DD-metalloendopeptidase family protein [Halomonas sp. DQ26W]RDB42400.1 LysM peptidoglycan-binding domain-containing protein [Halomonas sp. DQ26W]
MRKVLLVSAVALAMTGCAVQQEHSAPQVRDLSVSRERVAASQYTVEAGDTLYGIAWRHEMDYRDLARLNQISPPYRIEPGQQLQLDGSGVVGLRADDTRGQRDVDVATATALGGAAATGDTDWLLPDDEAIERTRRLTVEPLEEDVTSPRQAAVESAGQIAAATQAPAERQPEQEREPEPMLEAVAEPEVAESPAPAPAVQAAAEPDAGTQVAGAPEQQPERAGRSYTPVEEVDWRWPADGTLIGHFGEGGSITAGIDIDGQKGQPVRAAGPGIVVYAGSGVRGYGNLILLKHNDQYLSAYAHNDTLRVSENDVVEAGEVIATMGDSDAESVRLHFEVRKDGQPQDPLNYLPER